MCTFLYFGEEACIFLLFEKCLYFYISLLLSQYALTLCDIQEWGNFTVVTFLSRSTGKTLDI